MLRDIFENSPGCMNDVDDSRNQQLLFAEVVIGGVMIRFGDSAVLFSLLTNSFEEPPARSLDREINVGV